LRTTGAAIGLCLLLAACQGKTDQEAIREESPAKTSSQLPTAAASNDPARPDGADGVDAQLAVVKAFNERVVQEMASIAVNEAKIDKAASGALEAARGADAAPEARRQALNVRITAARREAEAARAILVDGQTKLRKDTDEQITAVEAMLETCNGSQALMVYESCTALVAEHELLLKNLEALAARYQAADAAYGPDRAKLEEASAAIALAAMR
jgi:hypothetical protein